MEWLLSLDEKERVYGIPRKEWPDASNENLFPCWRCRDWKPWFYHLGGSFLKVVVCNSWPIFDINAVVDTTIVHDLINVT